MPIVELHMLKGYDVATRERLGEALTDAVRFVVPAVPEAITVMIREVPSEDYFRGGTHRFPAPALPDPSETVRAFLAAMEARDLPAAQGMLSPDFTMQFPGTPPMHTLQDLVDWAAPRYRFVTKSYERFDALQGSAEEQVVYCYGTLSGEWPDGTAFSDIRFIDRFELRAGRISRQDVWNDIAEVKAQA